MNLCGRALFGCNSHADLQDVVGSKYCSGWATTQNFNIASPRVTESIVLVRLHIVFLLLSLVSVFVRQKNELKKVVVITVLNLMSDGRLACTTACLIFAFLVRSSFSSGEPTQQPKI